MTQCGGSKSRLYIVWEDAFKNGLAVITCDGVAKGSVRCCDKEYKRRHEAELPSYVDKEAVEPALR